MTEDPLKERVLAIVTILAQYFLDERDDPNESTLVDELLAAGFGSEGLGTLTFGM